VFLKVEHFLKDSKGWIGVYLVGREMSVAGRDREHVYRLSLAHRGQLVTEGVPGTQPERWAEVQGALSGWPGS
jgi:hypothetical protein